MKTLTTAANLPDQPEVCFNYDETAVPESDADWIIKTLGDLIDSGSRYQDGQTMQMGWMILQFSLQDDGRLHLMEPNMVDIPVVYIDSLTHTLKHLRQQKDVVESIDMEGLEPDFPALNLGLVVTKDYENCNEFFLNREEADDRLSGLFFRDTSVPEEELSDDNIGLVSVYEFACKRPDLIKFLALPVGYGVYTSNSSHYYIIHDDGEAPIRRDSFLDRLNTEST